ncbi:putative oxygen-independent coproporphyrinogen III oxidase [Marmoricola sp. OAE513]|uniref:radical SAM family heme chaperone HemW n=1 Tax=Marmoricola sp. OAE513 TaxID=2817894 RepID=UPI001AE4AF5A
MPSSLPDGDPAPRDGSLPSSALAELSGRKLGAYLHVPYCSVRCGYCDFNTYTATELGGGASQASYAVTAVREVELLADVLVGAPPVETVFFGGGTPTLLPSADLVAMLAGVRDGFGLAADAEVTTEANPDSVTPESLAELRAGGFTRISFGMQSAVPAVLAVLDRTHDPEGVPRAVAWAREAGFEQVSLDLIYGTPGESVADWEKSVRAALACSPDHVSAYSLIVEDGTALARQVRSGVIPMPDEDDLADKYELVDDLLGAAGLGWYEVSNWSRDEGSRCRHNELYWTSQNWLGVGPGAHAHVGGVRWWNAKHPTAYAARLAAGESPGLAREVLDAETRRVERVLLEVRLRDGLPVSLVDRSRVDAVVAQGLAEVVGERLVLTRPGRLLADAVVRDLLG